MNDDPSTPRSRSSWSGWTVVAMALAAADLSRHLFQGWVPHDEGALGLAARLVRGGAWPHRDFTDIYTGGLALLDAGAQWALGDDLRALRIPFGIAAVLWVGILAACFRRFVAPLPAAALALLAYLWGPPLYPAAMPTWYLLFLGTAMVWALLRWQGSGDPRWWGAVGALIGAALLIKISALFFLAAAGGILLLDGTSPAAPGTGARPVGGLLASALLITGTAGAVLLLIQGWGWERAVSLALPLVALTLAGADRLRTATWPELLTRVGRPALWGLAGVAAMLLPWVLAYAWAGALGDLVQGTLVLPFRRTASARFMPPSLGVIAGLGAVAAAAALLWRLPRPAALRGGALVLALAVWGVLRAEANDMRIIIGVWTVLRLLAPVLVVVGAARWHRDGDRRLLVPLWVAAWFALVQYPFAAPIYFVYAFPLLLLAATAVVVAVGGTREIAVGAGSALTLWTLVVSHGQTIDQLAWRNHPHPPVLTLPGPHGGLEVPWWDAEAYGRLTALLEGWGATRIVAGPDAPDVYYLGGHPFPDREFFEFMAPEWSAAVLARRIVTHRAQAAVLNTRPGFSRVSLDSVVALLPAPPLADTLIGRFRILRLPALDASP